jgi:thymidylate synthase
MEQYLAFLKYIKENGVNKQDRTYTGTRSIFGYQMRFDLKAGFPMVTTKKIPIKSIIYELLWFLKGDTNIHYLNQNGVYIWNQWADDNGDLGPIYGQQWRSWPTQEGGTIDQIQWVINEIKQNPLSRRLVVSAWNPSFLPDESLSPSENARMGLQALAPCHMLFQFYIVNNCLSCLMYQRSADAFIGVPFNIASYALLTHMIAHQCDLDVGELIFSAGDCHIYNNHQKQVALQLSRSPYKRPMLYIHRKAQNIDDYEYADFELYDYKHHPAIKAHVAV